MKVIYPEARGQIKMLALIRFGGVLLHISSAYIPSCGKRQKLLFPVLSLLKNKVTCPVDLQRMVIEDIIGRQKFNTLEQYIKIHYLYNGCICGFFVAVKFCTSFHKPAGTTKRGREKSSR